MAQVTTSINTPIGELNYTFISGDGRDNLSGVAQYSTQLVMSEEESKPLLEAIENVWVQSGNKKEPKSMGYKTLEDGRLAFNFKTNVEGKFGKTKIKVFDAKGKEANFSNTLIGNGSKGRVGATVSYYEQGPNAGVTLYLNKIQILELIEYTGGGEDFDTVEGGYEYVNEYDAEKNGAEASAPTPTPNIRKF